MDQAQLQLVIEAQADRVLAGLSSVERSLASVGKTHADSATQAERHSKILDSFGDTLQKVARYANLFVAFETIKRAFDAFAGLEQHNIELLRTTEILGGNATAASTWAVVAHEMGLNLDQIDKGFAKLATDLNSVGNPALKQMGIAAEDAQGHLRPLNDIINQAADYFHAHAGAANNAALANALFGRSGYELLPVLEQGTAGLQAITEEARKYGLILDSTTIQRNAAFTFQLKESQLALDGVGIAIGNAALPGIAALGQALSKVIEDNLPAFVAMIDRAISYVIGFIEGVTGMTLQVGEGALALSDLSTITGDTGSAMDKATSASSALADAIQKVRDLTKGQTDAIDDQINALQRQQQAQQFMDQQARLQEELANKSHDIDKLRQQQYQQFWLGNFQTASDIGDQITQAEQSQGDLRRQINESTLGQQTKDQVAALQAQKQSIEEAANKQIEAMQKAGRGSTAALAAAAGAVPGLYSKAAKEAGISFAQDFEATIQGSDMGKKLQDAILGPITAVVDSGRGGMNETVKRASPQWQAVGAAIGTAIVGGMEAALGAGVTGWVHDLGKKLQSVANQVAFSPIGSTSFGIGIVAALEAEASALQHFHGGGVVGGTEGQEQIVKALSGELILTRAQQASLFGAPVGSGSAAPLLASPGRGVIPEAAETNRLLRRLIEVVGASGSGSSTGVDALVNQLVERGAANRRRIGAGSFGR